MKRKDVMVGMVLYAWTSMWGEFLIEVTGITDSRPARVYGKVIKILKRGFEYRANVPLLGRTVDVGIISVKIPTEEQLLFEGV